MSVKPVAWTPGPWKRIDAKVYGADGEPVARAWHDRGAVERDANAVLIEAAPELAEALQRIVDNCQDCDGEGTQFYADGRTAGGGAFENHRPCPNCSEARKLLARITPK